MRWLVLVGLAACYSPKVHPGAPCGAGGACPGDLVCAADSTCEPASDAANVDASIDGSVAIDAPAGPDACATCIAPSNDLPAGAIDITAGGDFTADLTYAHDDASRPLQGSPACGMAGGLDVFYTVHLTQPEVYYIDTFGSTFNTLIRVVPGACAGGVAPNGVTCRNDATWCNGSVHTQWAGSLGTGDTCIIIDGYDGTDTAHALKMRVERGHRDGLRIATQTPSGPYTFSNNTMTATNVTEGSCSMHGDPDIAYYFTSCPGQSLAVTATTCNATTAATTWDTVVYASGPGGELACADDDGAACAADGQLSTISFTATGAHLFWVTVDGAGGTPSGAYALDLTFP